MRLVMYRDWRGEFSKLTFETIHFFENITFGNWLFRILSWKFFIFFSSVNFLCQFSFLFCYLERTCFLKVWFPWVQFWNITKIVMIWFEIKYIAAECVDTIHHTRQCDIPHLHEKLIGYKITKNKQWHFAQLCHHGSQSDSLRHFQGKPMMTSEGF